MGKLLKAEHHNWDLATIYDWKQDVFELSYDGKLHILVKYMDPVVDCVVYVSEDDLEKIQTLIPQINIDKRVDACDGSAWKFTAYDPAGKKSFQRDIGYIYGIEPLENIADILSSYIPEYEKPQYPRPEHDKIPPNNSK